MLLVLLACTLEKPPSGSDRHSGTETGTPGDDTSTEKHDTSTEEYDCVALDQVAPGGKTVPSGYEYCAVDSTNGFFHRVAAIDVAIDPYGDPDQACNPEGLSADCKTNSDCGEGSVCQHGYWGGCQCVDKCRTDDDCGLAAACIPKLLPLVKNTGGMSGSNECVSGECLTDADCPSGWCVVTSPCGRGYVSSLQCFSPKDECRTAKDCSDGKECYSNGEAFYCDYFWSCG
jgi:hypothetical protein